MSTKPQTIFTKFGFSEQEANIRIVSSLKVGEEKGFTYKKGKRAGKAGTLYPIKAILNAAIYDQGGFITGTERVYIDTACFLGDEEDAWDKLQKTLDRYRAFEDRDAVTIAFDRCQDASYTKGENTYNVLKVGSIDILSIDSGYVQEELARQDQMVADGTPPSEEGEGDEEEEDHPF